LAKAASPTNLFVGVQMLWCSVYTMQEE
jgi:hypothetical protein